VKISEFCIRRPVATILMSVALVVSGLFAYRYLSVAALPDTDFPVINVSAALPGASPETMAKSVATPLIKQFETIEGVDSINSTNTEGATSISIQFDLSRNIDAAAADVQSAIASAARRLPSDMPDPPSYRKVNPADFSILFLALNAKTTPLSKIDDTAEQLIAPKLSTIPGVAQVLVWGSQKFAVRIEVDPTALAARGIGLDQVKAAVAAANSIAPVGTLQGRSQSITIEADTPLDDAAQFADIVIATKNGQPIRLGDVARVINSVENTQTSSTYDGQRNILLAIYRQPDANTVDVVDHVKAMLPTFKSELPRDATLTTLIDRAAPISAAVHDVEMTLGLTVILVILVIFLFLQRVAATLIPSFAVPISIIATLGGMYLFGFSIDNVSLMGLTLAVGLVVDDAIVMLENIFRHMEEEGLSAMQAALVGSREIGFTILSITVSLCAVFIPILLMGGVVGLVFNEFAVVVTMAIIASAFVSLTLTPMLCSRVLRVAHKQGAATPRGIMSFAERGFDLMYAGYRAALGFCLRFRFLVLMVFFGTVVASVYLFMIIPKGFFPLEDLSQLSISTEARQDISYPAMVKLQNEVAAVFQKSPYVKHMISIVGQASGQAGSLNQGRGFVELKPKDQRPPLNEVMATLRRQLAQIPGITTYMVPVQDLRFGTHRTKSQYQYVLQGLDEDQLYSWSEKMADAMSRDRATFADVTTDMQNDALQATLKVDTAKANALGITADQLRNTLYAGFGTQQISTIYKTGDSYQVIMEFDPEIPWTPNMLNSIYVRAANGTLVPVGSIAKVVRTTGPLSVNQVGQLPAVTVSFNLPGGVSLGQAVNRLDDIKASIEMPQTITSSFSGDAQIFQQSLANEGVLLIAAVVTIYIVLGILYESFIHPLTILTGLPAAGLGALLTLKVFGFDLSVIAVIGILMLIGIVKKNAIMMIDVALKLKRDGAPSREAIYRACLLRFRPIMMTTFAAIMGTLPIAVGAGTSAELRQPLGVAVVGGLVVSQALTLFITPVIFLYMESLSHAVLSLPARVRRWRGKEVPHGAPAE
jgi:HAE1 family hydrophobic/amphiphilic exporter-1